MYAGTKRLDHLALSRNFPGWPIAFLKRKGEEDGFKGNLINLKNEKIGVVRPVIKYNYLYFAISRKIPSWEKTLKDLNAALEEFETSGLLFHIIQSVNAACAVSHGRGSGSPTHNF